MFNLYGIGSDIDVFLLLYTQFLFHHKEPCIAYRIYQDTKKLALFTGVTCEQRTIYNRLEKLEERKFFIQPKKKLKSTEYRSGKPYIPLPLGKLLDIIAQQKAIECKLEIQRLKRIQEIKEPNALQRQAKFLISGNVARNECLKIAIYRELICLKDQENIDSVKLGDLKCVEELQQLGKKDYTILWYISHLMQKHLIEKTEPLNFETRLIPLSIEDATSRRMDEIIAEVTLFYETYPPDSILHQDTISMEVLDSIFGKGGDR